MSVRATQAERQRYIDEHCLTPQVKVIWAGQPAVYVGRTPQAMARIRTTRNRLRTVCPTSLSLDMRDYSDEMDRIAPKRMPL